MVDLYDLFAWFESTGLGQVVRTSTWLFPVIEALHLVALCLLGAALFVVDFRLLGVGLQDRTPAQLAIQARPWLIAAVAALFSTGIPLFLSEAVKCYYIPSFWIKMGALLVAVIFAFTLRPRLLASMDTLDTTMAMRGLAVVSLALWFTVAAAGRWIGFSG